LDSHIQLLISPFFYQFLFEYVDGHFTEIPVLRSVGYVCNLSVKKNLEFMLKKHVDGLNLKLHLEILNFEGLHGAEISNYGGFNFAACI